MDQNKSRVAVAAIVSVTVLAIAIFIWPTPYHYSVNSGVIYRTNRLTADTVAIRPHPQTEEIDYPKTFGLVVGIGAVALTGWWFICRAVGHKNNFQ